VTSPITFAPVYVPSIPQSSTSFIVTGLPRFSTFSSRSASGLESAAAGIGFTPSAKFVTPVCGVRLESVPAERSTNAAAPFADAIEGPVTRTVEPMP
jgi:hypothetical protein